MITKKTSTNEILSSSTNCRMCGKCCTLGVGFVKEEEIEKIAEHLKLSKESFKEKFLVPHLLFNTNVYKFKQTKLPFGPCIFLKDKKCVIQEVKPLHCRVGNCNKDGEELTEWYYSNNLVDYNDPQSIREWHTRVTLKPTIKGGSPEEILGEKLVNEIVEYRIFTREDLDEHQDKKNKKNNNEV